MQTTQRVWHPERVLGARWLGLSAAVLAVICLSACGGSADKPNAAAALLHRKPPPGKMVPKVTDPTAEMSAAVTTAKGPSPVNVKFQLAARPEPGKPLTVDFALIPDATVSSVAVKFEGESGLTLVSGDQVPEINKPTPNAPIRHSVVVLPKADGIYALTATVTATNEADPRVRAFTIPIISGQGLSPGGPLGR